MEKELVDIVLHKSYIELSSDERNQLVEWCSSEEEYDQMKLVFIEVESMKNQQKETVRPETKKSLDALFAEKHKQSPVFWNKPILVTLYPREKSIHRRPLVQIAAVALLLLLAYPLTKTSTITPDVSLTAQVEEQLPSSQGSKNELGSKETPTVKKEVKTAKPLLVASVDLKNLTLDKTTMVRSDDNALAPASASWSDHPDGIFVEENVEINFSQSVSDTPEMLDLLTVSF